MTSNSIRIRLGVIYFTAFTMVIGVYFLAKESDWKAPPEADKLTNPVKGNAQYTQQGRQIFDQVCWTCHGDNGKGRGPASAGLDPAPADFTSDRVQSQSDGAIYWKITEGRGSMASYKKKYSDVQRWSLVNVIREYGKSSMAKSK